MNDSVVYYIKAKSHLLHNILNLVLETLGQDKRSKVERVSFYLDYIHVYLCVDKDGGFHLYLKDSLLKEHNPDLELAVWTDISTIPLIHNPVYASKFNS